MHYMPQRTFQDYRTSRIFCSALRALGVKMSPEQALSTAFDVSADKLALEVLAQSRRRPRRARSPGSNTRKQWTPRLSLSLSHSAFPFLPKFLSGVPMPSVSVTCLPAAYSPRSLSIMNRTLGLAVSATLSVSACLSVRLSVLCLLESLLSSLATLRFCFSLQLTLLVCARVCGG